jgi:hypothetical protein
MNSQTPQTLRNYLKNSLALLLLSIAWFLVDQRHAVDATYKIFILLFGLTFGAIVFLWLKKPDLGNRQPARENSLLYKITVLSGILLTLLFHALPIRFLQAGSARLVILTGWSLFCGFLVSRRGSAKSPWSVFLTVLLMGGVFYRIGAFVNEVSSSPFSLGWSEGSRIYNASLFFAQKIYGQKLPLPVLHPSRYLLQSLPFLFGIKSILIHRLWQVVLWIGMTAWGSWLMASRLAGQKKAIVFWLSAFLFLFFFQGAVYYHLMVCVIVTLIGYSSEKPWKTLLFVILASIWAGISRINWLPVPALLAVSIFLLETPLDQQKIGAYLKFPILWTLIGGAVGYASKQVYQAISNENAAVFDSAFSSQLLWARLFPNATFIFGILLAVGLASLPIFVFACLRLRATRTARIHWLRMLGLAGILLVFLAGGILVSLKIGGGGDLHNLDAYLVFLALICLSVILGHVKPEPPEVLPQICACNHVPAFLLALVVFVPVWFAFMRSGNWNLRPDTDQQTNLAQIQQAVKLLNEEPGQILFVTERQLITMGAIEGVELVPDYEKVFLMEMAMGNNQAYLQRFYRQLDEHQFKAILMEPISTSIQAPWKSFAEENNSYVRNVILPMLMDYQLALSWNNGEINLLIPNGEQQLMDRLKAIQND